MPSQKEIEKLRRLGLVRRLESGDEAVNVTAQFRGPSIAQDRQSLKAEMEAWELHLSGTLAKHGGVVVPNTLSVSAQTVEALVPTTRLDALTSELEDQDVRVDLVTPRQVLND